MAPAIIGVFVPIVLFIVIGIVLVSSGFFDFNTRKLLVEKGLDIQSVKEFLENKKDPYILMKIGIIAIAFGIGLGLGMMMQDYTDKDYWVPFALFTITGIGFVAANIASRIMLSKNNKKS
jgi:intracellular septation protein A